MNVNGYSMNYQYQKTQLSYEMSLSKVDPNEESQKLLENENVVDGSNLPVVYMSDENLSNYEVLTKMILEATYSQYSSSNSKLSLFPNIQTTNGEDIPDEIQAYGAQDLPSGLVYTSSSEYYEKTTVDFSGEIRIKTPSGEYNIELNLSYSQEFYEKNANFVEIANENLLSPLEIELDEDNENLKDLKAINLLFENRDDANSSEPKNDFFTQLIESLEKRKEYIDSLFTKPEESIMDNYEVYMSRNEEEYQLISAQKDGLGVFFSHTQSESSYLSIATNPNGSYISAGYSSSQTTTISSFEAIKA